MLGLDIQDSRLKTVIDFFEKGNIKKALIEVNKIIKKCNDTTAKVLKALILLKSGKTSDADAIAEEVISLCPTDESTLSAILCYFRETGQSARATDYLKTALEKCPNREDLLVCLFLNHVQAGDFSAQQATARLLLQRFSTRLYTYWVIVSTLMQADEDPSLGERMYLPLAEKLLLHAISSNKMEKHMEFQLLIDVLGRLGKHKDALDFLNLDHFIASLDSGDYNCDYSRERLQLLACLDRWEDTLALAKQMLIKNANNWDVWKCLINMVTNYRGEQQNRLLELNTLIALHVEQHPSNRGPHLARLDLLATLMKGDMQVPNDSDPATIIKDYLRRFASKPICAFDLAYLLPILLPANHDRFKLLEGLLKELDEDHIKVPLDPSQACRYLCTYQIARANGHAIPLHSLLTSYLTFVPERQSIASIVASKKLGEEEGNSTSIDLCPADGILLLALSSLVEHPLNSTLVPRCLDSFGLGLLAAYWIQHLGIVHASTNHHFRLRMCALFGPHILGCPDLCPSQINRLDIKQLLFVSLGYLVVSPVPVLTLWSASMISSNLPEDCSPVFELYRRIGMISTSIVSEAEEGILAAYRRCAYTRVREFTQFAKRLRNADVFQAARLELLNWKIIVLPDSFDSALEHMGTAVKELDLVEKRLEHIVDCRDYSVSPTFDPPIQGIQTAEDTFSHEVQWLHMRFLTLRLVHSCAELVMCSVKLSDQLLADNAELLTDGRADSAFERIDQCINAFDSLQEKAPGLPSLNASELTRCLTLESKRLLLSPAQLPLVQPASFYIHGPFSTILHRGVSLVTGVYRFLMGESAYIAGSDGLDALSFLSSSSAVHPRGATCETNGETIFSFWSDLPSPSKADMTDGATYLTNSTACHPAGVLLLLGCLLETFSISFLFISMLHSMLRPRSHYLQSTKRQKRKATSSVEASGTKSVSKSEHLFKGLDSLGSHLLILLDDLERAVLRIIDVAEAWVQWSELHAVTECVQLASNVCTAVLPPSLLEQFPILIPDTRTTLFAEVAGSYQKCFIHLIGSFRLKLRRLSRMRHELRVYSDCASKLAACDLRDTIAS